MATKPHSDDTLRAVLAAVEAHGGVSQAATALGQSYGTFQSRYRAAIARFGKPKPKAADSPVLTDSFAASGDNAELTKGTHEDVRSLPDLIRVCEIDTSEWEVERFVCNKWAVGAKNNDGELISMPLYQVKAWLKRRGGRILTLEKLKTDLVADIRAEVKRGPVKASTPRRQVEGGWLFEFSPFDLHMGKYTWDEETVTNYDTDMAADLFNASLDFLLSQALKLSDGKLSRVLCVFGNDVSHTDGKKGETTAGTRMDVDTRYIRVYRRICEVHRRAIDVLRQVAPVDVTIVPGNHDELTSFHLGEILATRYEDVPHVTVDNSAKLRKYYEYGVNLFGFAHGDSEKVNELPLTMAREVPDLWARCPSREWHIGHKHIAEKKTWPEQRTRQGEQDLFSDKGVRVRRLSSLSAHDAWHTKHAYMDRRACDGFVFHREAGFTNHLSFNVDHFTGKALRSA